MPAKTILCRMLQRNFQHKIVCNNYVCIICIAQVSCSRNMLPPHTLYASLNGSASRPPNPLIAIFVSQSTFASFLDRCPITTALNLSFPTLLPNQLCMKLSLLHRITWNQVNRAFNIIILAIDMFYDQFSQQISLVDV